MAVQTPEVEALNKPAPVLMDPRTLRHLNAIIANKSSMLEPKREGFDRAFDQTFGAGKFRLSANGGDAQDYIQTDEHGYSVYSSEVSNRHDFDTVYYQEVIHDLQEELLEMFTPEPDDWYGYDDYPPQDYYFNPNTGGFDLADPATFEYVSLAEIEYDDDGQAVGINTENSCMRIGTHEDGTMTTGQALLNAKLAMEDPLDLTDEYTRDMVSKATLHAEEGYLEAGGECVAPDSVRAKKIELAKAQLAEEGGPQSVAATPAPSDLDGEAPSEVSANAQGNDYAAVAQALTAPKPAPALDTPGVEATVEAEAPAPEVVAAAPVYKPAAPPVPGM